MQTIFNFKKMCWANTVLNLISYQLTMPILEANGLLFTVECIVIYMYM